MFIRHHQLKKSMKKIILAAVISIACTTFVKAQTNKGNLFMGTSIGSSTYSSDNQTADYSDGNYAKTNSKGFAIGISPEIGAFLSDHFVLGGNLTASYGHSSVTENNTEGAVTSYTSSGSSTIFSVGPFARYYFFDAKPSATLLYLQANASIGTGTGSSSRVNIDPTFSTTDNGNLVGLLSTDLGASVGVTHFIQKTIGLDLSVGYNYGHETYSDNVGDLSRHISIGANSVILTAGFHFFLP